MRIGSSVLAALCMTAITTGAQPPAGSWQFTSQANTIRDIDPAQDWYKTPLQ